MLRDAYGNNLKILDAEAAKKVIAQFLEEEGAPHKLTPRRSREPSPGLKTPGGTGLPFPPSTLIWNLT